MLRVASSKFSELVPSEKPGNHLSSDIPLQMNCAHCVKMKTKVTVKQHMVSK